MFVLDTNVIISYFKGEPRALNWIDTCLGHKNSLAISTVTVTELLCYTRATVQEILYLENLFKNLVIVDVDLTIARIAAKLRIEHKLKVIDSLIGATAFAFHVPLVTADLSFRKLGKSVLVL